MKSSQSKILTVMIAVAAVSILGWRLFIWGTTPRQTAVRTNETAYLKQASLYIMSYVSDNQSLPAHLSLLKKDFPAFAEEFDKLEQCITPDGNLLVYRREAFREIKRGEPAGGLGEYADADIPPARAYMIINGSPDKVNNGEFELLEGPRVIRESDFRARFSVILNSQQEPEPAG